MKPTLRRIFQRNRCARKAALVSRGLPTLLRAAGEIQGNKRKASTPHTAEVTPKFLNAIEALKSFRVQKDVWPAVHQLPVS